MIQVYLYFFGLWEPDLSAFVASRMVGQQDRVFVDIGANIGYFSLLAARAAPSSQIVSVEPFPTIYQKLAANVALNRCLNVRTLQVAVSDHRGHLDLYFAGPGNEGATTSRINRHNVPATTVPCATLPDILSEAELSRVRMIKIDVEGAEHAVVSGLLGVLKQLPMDAEFVIELSPELSRPGAADEIVQLFAEHGYHAYSIRNDYDPNAYLAPSDPARPTRFAGTVAQQTDMVFSRLVADHL